MSDFLQPHELQNARLPCLSQSPWICSNSCPLSRWCHLTISSFVALFFFCLQSFLGSVSSIRWPKYWSFSISPSNKYSGLMSFWIDWFVLLAVQRTLKSSPAPELESIHSSVISIFYGTLTSMHDYWKNHSFDYMNLCQQSDVSAFY